MLRFNLTPLKTLSIFALGLGSLLTAACSADPEEIPQSEYYAREFYRTFGKISKDQDWTAATRGTLTVNTPAATTLRIIADVDGQSYLFGEYALSAGEREIAFDLPKHATNLRAEAFGIEYRIGDGKHLDLATRALGESGTYAGIEVTIEENQHGRQLTLLPAVAQEALSKLPENSEGVQAWSQTNSDKVTDNFSAYASEFYLFPEFWNTSGHSSNVIGVYWEVAPETPGAEHIITYAAGTYSWTSPQQIEGEYWIMKVPFFSDPKEFLIPYQATQKTAYTYYNEISEWPAIWERLVERFSDKYALADGTGAYKDKSGNSIQAGTKVRLNKDGSYTELLLTNDEECSNDVVSVFPGEYLYSSDSQYLMHIDEAVEKTHSGNASYYSWSDFDFYKSKGVHVKFSEKVRFGFYLQQGTYIMYSQTKLNEWVQKENKEGEMEWRRPSYAATFRNGTDTEGNDKRHLCFEDWYNDNWDLNDMVFRVYGFDNIVTKQPDEDPLPDGGKIDDEDEPEDPTPVDPTPTPTVKEYPAYPWIVACEDLGATDDYDFNDVVFGVEHVAGTRFVYVTALAAGGTLPARLYYSIDGQKYEIHGGSEDDFNSPQAGNQYTISRGTAAGSTFTEWHQWFGNHPSSEMLNTQSANISVGATVRITLPEGKADQFSMSNNLGANWADGSTITHMGGFTVEIEQANGTTNTIRAPYRTENEADNIPQLFTTTHAYHWPWERASIYKTHAGTDNLGTTPTGHVYGTGSFMHWLKEGDVANFHTTPPSAPGSTIAHGWSGDVKYVETTLNGKTTYSAKAYGNTYPLSGLPSGVN